MTGLVERVSTSRARTGLKSNCHGLGWRDGGVVGDGHEGSEKEQRDKFMRCEL